MERSTFRFDSYFRKLDMVGVNEILDSCSKDPAFSKLLDEANGDVPNYNGLDIVPERNRKVLESLVTKLFQTAVKWKPIPIVNQHSKTDYALDLSFDLLKTVFRTNQIYDNLREIFVYTPAVKEFDEDMTLGTIQSDHDMVMFFVTKGDLKSVNGTDNKLDISQTLIEHCKHSQRSKISLRNVGLKDLPSFDHAADVSYLVLGWNSLTAIDLSPFRNLLGLSVNYNELTEVPKHLPDTLVWLDLTGNRIQSLNFDKLPESLLELNISHMHEMVIPESFWKLLDGKFLVLKFSNDMQLTFPNNIDLTRILTLKTEHRETIGQPRAKRGLLRSIFKWSVFVGFISIVGFAFMKLWQRYKPAR